MFNIAANGSIYPVQEYNWEEENQYTITVFATDGGNVPKTGSATVIVNIEDRNDHAPTFPDGVNQIISIYENITGGKLIETIQFSDGDEPDSNNSLLHYYLIGGSGIELFSIDKYSGELRTAEKAEFNHENTTEYTLVIEARDSGVPQLTGNATFTVKILNVDDSDPHFLRNFYYFSVPENSQIGYFVGRVQARDEDPFNKQFVYSIDMSKTSLAAAGNFSVDNVTGNVTTLTVLDRELHGEQFILIVNVGYSAEENYTDTTTVIITIKDVDEFNPKVTKFNNINLVEGIEINEILDSVTAEDADPSSKLRYTLTSPDSVLKINSTTGEISTAKVIDREALPNPTSCPSGTPTNTSCYTISVIVRDITALNKIAFRSAKLLVQDLDDTPPVFDSLNYSVTIKENLPVGTELDDLDIEASDQDLGIILGYEIEGNADFSIHYRTAIVSVANELDYETTKSYNLTLTVKDSQNNQGTAELIITITDYNDNNPEFKQDYYNATVEEGASVTIFVAKVEANDIDSDGPNSDIEYSIIDGNDPVYFEIDKNTGIVTVANDNIDRETTPNFTLTILAKDNGTPSLNSTVKLYITVEDISDEPPYFIQSAFYGEVKEGVASGSPVYVNGTNNPLFITAVDPDLNAVVTIITYNKGPFNVDANNGEVTVDGKIDYEDTSSYELTCVAHDQENIYSSPVSVYLTVLNIDDNIPVFEEDSYSTSVAEDTDIGANIIKVIASDSDVGDVVAYKISETNSLFAINSSTGQIFLNETLNYEDKTTHIFTVLASSDNFNNYSSVLVTVTVTDVNDEPPVFRNMSYSADLAENEQSVIVLTVVADDIDTNSVVNYKLLSGNTSYFTIGKTNGIIRAADNADIDYEQFTSLSFTVLAFNPDEPLLNDTVEVTVNIVDRNDETPTFSAGTYNINIRETLRQNDKATQANATDKDTLPEYNTIVYSIVLAVPNDNTFDINATTGVIFVSVDKLPSTAEQSQYVLTIEASDGTLDSTAIFYLNVVDVNMMPVFTQSSYSMTLEEDYSLDTVFLTVEATEETDVNNNAAITYSILLLDGYVRDASECPPTPVSGSNNASNSTFSSASASGSISGFGSGFGSGSSDTSESESESESETETPTEAGQKQQEVEVECLVFPFTINNMTGEISLQEYLDFETNETWSFSVIATDSADQPKSATVPVTITVTDINDEKPYFTQENYNVNVSEGLKVGSLVTDIVKAEDKDTVSQGKLKYYIMSGAEGRFTIDQESGNITLIKSLELKVYSLTIEVNDGSFDTEVELTINVQDVNNNAPVFSKDSYEGTFKEDVSIGTSVLMVSATDADLGSNGIVSYRLVNASETFFNINSTSGWIYTTGEFDYETPPNSHELTVEAYDNGLNKNTAEVTVTLTEVDVNDERPVFSAAEYMDNLPEGDYVKYFVTTISASDRDSGQNGEIDFYLNGSSKFFIDSNGLVFAVGKFDYDNPLQEMRVYILNVTAQDKGSKPLSNTTTLTINVTDTNDNAPVFDPIFHRILIPENTTVNDTVFTVKATDLDSAENGRITYSFVGSHPDDCNANETYHLDPNTGAVTLSEPVDIESDIFNLECNLLIRAVDNGSPQHSADVTYAVVITDINEHPPEVTSSTKAFVPENSKAGYEFYTIETTDQDPNPLSYEEIEGDTELFTVTADGKIAVLKNDSLDFDEPPKTYNLTILVTENGKPAMSTTVTVTISLTDLNDITPEFLKDKYVASVRENKAEGHIITYVTAVDFDSPPNKIIKYSIVKNSENETDYGKFTIDSNTGAVKVGGVLDYETERRVYPLVIQASDGVNSATVPLKIRVLESNDNAPEFTNLPNTTSIYEDASNGTYVFQVHATDLDISVNGKITYSLDKDEDMFVIDPDTGVIRVQLSPGDSFDFESGVIQIVVTVYATDKAGTEGSGKNIAEDSSGFGDAPLVHINDTMLQTMKDLIVEILDVNDEPPVFSQTETVYVAEHDENQIFVTQVSASDADKPNTNNSEVRYLIIDGDVKEGDPEKFKIDPITGVITSIPPIDKEEKSSYKLKVVAHDLGVPQKSSTVTVTVEITDVDDEAPDFTQEVYSAFVDENKEEDEFVFQVEATDLDQNGTSAVYYSLIDSTNYFKIDNLTGEITTTSVPIDHETHTNITLTVVAEDEEGFTDTATVELTVKDENDNAPILNQKTYIIELTENAEVGKIIDEIDSVDPDSSSNAITKYTMEQTDGHDNRFQISQINGNIEIINALCFDSPSQETYKFTVTASDTNKPELNTTAVLTVLVIEENLYAPQFERPSYVSRLDSLAKSGTVVISQFKTTDADPCSKAPVFNIEDGNIDNTFTINSATGEIKLARDLNSTDLSFTLTISATDTGNFDVSDLTGSVRLIVLVGQLLPVSITAEGALMVPTISRASQDNYKQDVWLYNGLNQVESVSINYTLGATNEVVDVSINRPPVTTVYPTIITKAVYKHRANLIVSFQAEAKDYERVDLERTELFVSVQSPVGGSPINGSCFTDEYSGSVCVVLITVPETWFTYTEEDDEQITLEAVVSYGLSLDDSDLQEIGNVTLETRMNCSEEAGSFPEFRVTVPSKLHYPGETVEVSLEANAIYDIENFLIICDVSGNELEFDEVVPDNDFILSATTEYSGSVSVSGINIKPNSLTQRITTLSRLGSINFRVNTSVSLANVD